VQMAEQLYVDIINASQYKYVRLATIDEFRIYLCVTVGSKWVPAGDDCPKQERIIVASPKVMLTAMFTENKF
ncbi:MAG: hypothetical protein EZS28_011838, partial [Streblomastix strix]